jgi:pyruvate dehydrogenase E2 component (dihydrolipoamide acetyltransferase)
MVLLPPSRLQVNVTADHRIIYGAQAAEFLQTLKAVVENPDQLLL